MSTSRRVRRLTVRAPDRGAVWAASLRIEDAVRTASLPGLPVNGVVYLRRLELGLVSMDAPTHDLSNTIDEAVATLRVVPAGAGRLPDDQAAAVWFASELEPYRALAELIARGHRTRAWYWRLAVPDWSEALRPAQGALRILGGASRMSTGLTGLAYVAEPLLPSLLLEALEIAGPEVTGGWMERCGMPRRRIGEREEPRGGLVDHHDHRERGPRSLQGTPWVGRSGTPSGQKPADGERPARAGEDEPGSTPNGGSGSGSLEPRAPAPAARRLPSPAWQAAVRRGAARWGAADERATFLALLALASIRRDVSMAGAKQLVVEVGEPTPLERAVPRRGEPGEGGSGAPGPRGASRAEAARGHPDPGEAGSMLDDADRAAPPRPNAGALTTPLEGMPPRTPGPRRTSGDASASAGEPAQQAEPRRLATEAGPHDPSAPARADGDAERRAEDERRPAPESGKSQHGGFGFLVAALQRLGFPDFLETFPEYAESDLGLHVLARAADILRTAQDDPVRALLADTPPIGPLPVAFVAPLAWRSIADSIGAEEQSVRGLRQSGVPGSRLVSDAAGRLILARWHPLNRADVEPWLVGAAVVRSASRAWAWTYDSVVDNWVVAIARYGRRVAGTSLRRLVARPAHVAVTRTHFDVVFAMSGLDASIRAAGLDIDPGWVPWLGRVVRFHYVEGGEGS